MITMSSAMPVDPKSWFRSFIITARLWVLTGVSIGLLTLLAACSALRIGYSQAPELLYWYLDGYVDFDAAQTPRVRDALSQWLAWHRQTQLPDYATQLARMQTEVLADTTAARVCEWQGEAIRRADLAFDRAVPAVADFMLTLTPQQIQHVERRNAKANDEFRDDYLQADPRKRAEATLRRTIDRAESLYGKLTDAQRARLAEALPKSPFDPDVWLAERRLRQQDALSVMRKLGGGDVGRDPAQAALRAYAQRIQTSPRESYRRYAERLSEFNCIFAASMHNGTTAAQRRTAAQKLAGWEGDVRALVADAPRSATAEPR
jgi:hypothetical protein